MALAASVCVCMNMKRFPVLKMEISVLNFIWFTDKLKQMEKKKKSKGDQMYTFQGLLLFPCPGFSHSPSLLYSKDYVSKISAITKRKGIDSVGIERFWFGSHSCSCSCPSSVGVLIVALPYCFLNSEF